MATDVYELERKRFMELYEEAATFVKEQGAASCYALMDKFKIGYGKAVQLMDELEFRAVVQPLLYDADGAPMGAKGPRPLMTPEFKKTYEAHLKDVARIQEERRKEEEKNRPVFAAAPAPVEKKRKKK